MQKQRQPMSKTTQSNQLPLCSTSNGITMTRAFHPIGHGAFYTERFMQNDECKFSVVFDCGCYEAFKGGVPAGVFEDRIKRAIDNFYPKDKETINLLFISHFHTDHINGIEYLKDKCHIERIIVPQLTPEIVIEAYVFNYIQTAETDQSDGTPSIEPSDNTANKWIITLYEHRNNPENGDFPKVIQVQESKTDTEKKDIEETNIPLSELSDSISPQTKINCPIGEDSGIFSWLYIPFNLQLDKQKQKLLQDSIFKGAIDQEGNVNFKELNKILKDTNIEDLKKAYKKVFGKKHNSYSMTVFSGTECHRCFKYCHIRLLDFLRTKLCHYIPRYCTLNCLYCGDFEANPDYPKKECNTNGEKLTKYYQRYWDKIGLLQVPHHGSMHNLNESLYKPEKICIISAGKTDKYQHPNMPVLQAIWKAGSIPIIVTEDTRTQQEFTYHL